MMYRKLPDGLSFYLFVVDSEGEPYPFIAEATAEPHSLTWAVDQISAHGGHIIEVWHFMRGVGLVNSDGSAKAVAVNCTAGIAKMLFERLCQQPRIDDWNPSEVEFCIRHGYEDSIEEIRQDVARETRDWVRQEASFRGPL